jgi:hypothetical protein
LRRRDRQIIEVADCTPLDIVIERLQSLRASLSADAQAAVKVQGDDTFGWRLNVSYSREATPEEAELEARNTHVIKSR